MVVSPVSQSETDSTLYTTFEYTEYALATNSDKNWAVDSAATRHFSGYIHDFKTIKRWPTPRIVRTANNTPIEALGYGDIELYTTYGPYILRNVWWTPEFNCRLVSTSILNDGGVTVVLENRRLRATVSPNIVFKGTGQQGLYYVDLDQDSKAFATTSTL